MKLIASDRKINVNWARPIIEIVQNLNQPIYVIGELVYKPFFNDRFGPILNQVSVELVVENNAKELEHLLCVNHSDYRWCISEMPVEEKMIAMPFVFMKSAYFILGEQEEMRYYDSEAERHLLHGKIEPSSAYEKESEELASKLFSLYPGCSSSFFQLENGFKPTDWKEIEEEIHANEIGGRKCSDGLTEKEEGVAIKISQWHKENKKQKHLVPIPSRGNLPKGDPWKSKDAEYREWVIQQTLADNSAINKDEYLDYVLQLQKVSGQKPTHDGWEVYMHSIMSVLQIHTDDLEPALRKILRLTMIWHDVGKLRNVWTPGAHGAIGAKIWKKPDWLSKEEEELVKFLIKTHDYLGLMDRWLMDRDFKGGLSPNKIRRTCHSLEEYDPKLILELMKRVYDADISSVSRLRYFTTLTPLLEEIVLCDM